MKGPSSISICAVLVSFCIPLYKLKNEFFREILEKHTQHATSDVSELTNTYAPCTYHKTVQMMRDETIHGPIWVSLDKTNDRR